LLVIVTSVLICFVGHWNFTGSSWCAKF